MADINLLGGDLRRRRMVRLDSGDVPLNVAMSCESEMRTMVLLNIGVVNTPQLWVLRRSVVYYCVCSHTKNVSEYDWS